MDQPRDNGCGDQGGLANSLSHLNVNATEFVPGRTFVPSFTQNDGQAETNGPDKMEEEAPDDWDEKESDGEASPCDKGGGQQEIEMTEAEPQPAPAQEMQEEEEEEEEDEEPAPKPKQRLPSESNVKKEHLNIVFIGHVDAGKSTIGGHVMYLTGQVDKRTLEKYEKEAKEKNRETWYLSWALDTNLEERDKGKTVEVGRAYFETDKKHFTILDAPGHKSFVPNMIAGSSQADVAVLVISARRGEFETGFDRGGQTREHAMLVKTAGVKKLIVAVNKMDDPTVKWEESRYKDIQEKLTPYLKKCGFNPKTDLYYLPVSGLTGYNIRETNSEICPWYSGPALLEYLDKLPPMNRNEDGPVRLPVVDRYKDMGTIILGKVESGTVKKGQVLTLMPNKSQVEVLQLWLDEEDSDMAHSGENIKMKLKNVEEEDVSPGFVLCSPDSLCNTGRIFDAQVVIMEHKSIICAGYSAVMHIHTSAEEVTLKNLICTIDKKTNEKSKVRPRYIKQDQIAIVRLQATQGIICLESFKEFPQMGRFTLRDEGKTIAIGKVLKVIG